MRGESEHDHMFAKFSRDSLARHEHLANNHSLSPTRKQKGC